MISKLRNRWGIDNTFQVIIILIVFSCTGFSVLYVEGQMLIWLRLDGDQSWISRIFILLLIILPLYNLLLLMFGFVFGQFRFFWNFEKRFFGTIVSLFKKRN
ncbi:MAG: prolipoprotein diacylglyceryl transferase [Bacteroidetes bacterium]|nr:prolipoprotein diacylglyceryl transferase [Bacteroidota bacterium]